MQIVPKATMHFKKRAKERYGLTVNRWMHQEMIRLIEANSAEVVVKQSTERTLYKITYFNQELFVIYDHKDQKLITALPPEAYETTK
jgi:hypothetical protein